MGGEAGVTLSHGAEVAMGFQDGASIAPVHRGKRLEECQCVVEATCEQCFLAVAFGQILVQEQEVVAKVEVGFAWIALGQAAASQVVDMAIGYKGNVVASEPHAPAQLLAGGGFY
ncbi:Uncharacterised protein [Chlamydia trachomatis]|nr:Uncharacterised protein [Chlamydia trachomatis]